jgi:Zn-dependent metalloprotease
MRKHSLFAAALVSVVAGCSSGSDAPSESLSPSPGQDGVAVAQAGSLAPAGASAEQLRAFEALRDESGRAWTWIQDSAFGTPTHLSAARAGKAILVGKKDRATIERVTKRFLAEHKALFRMRDPDAELRMTKSEVDELAMTHARFQETVRGVRVVGAELMAHYDAAGRLASIDAQYVPDLDGLDVNPVLDASEGRAIAKADALAQTRAAGGEAGEADADASKLEPSDGELVVFANGVEPPALAYRYSVRAIFGAHPAIWVTTIDAKTGRILDRYDNLQTIDGSGTGVLGDTKKLSVSTGNGGYTLTDTSRGVTIQTYTAQSQQVTAEEGAAPIVSSSSTTWDQVSPGAGAAVDAHFYAGVVYDYYKNVHGRNAIDGKGGAMLSAAHFGSGYDNAFWDGASMSYGDGGQLFKPLSAGLDVVAHEFTHGVTQATSNLDYQGQPGALNEAVSDIFGVFIEHSLTPNDTNNWKMGELIAKGSGTLRDFKNPSVGQQPDNMSRYVNTQQDNGGVHINSGIVNNAAYLMTMGGKNPTSKEGPAFGVGWTKSEKLWYRVNTKYLTTSSKFSGAAQATMQAAQDLGFTANEQNIVDCAWKSTGVVQGACGTITDPDATTPQSTPGDTTGGAGSGDGTGAGDGSGDGAGDATGATGDGADGSSDDDGAGATKPKKRRGLGVTQSSGCSAAPHGAFGSGSGSGSAPGMLAFAVGAAVAGLARSRSRRARG